MQEVESLFGKAISRIAAIILPVMVVSIAGWSVGVIIAPPLQNRLLAAAMATLFHLICTMVPAASEIPMSTENWLRIRIYRGMMITVSLSTLCKSSTACVSAQVIH